MIQRPQPGQLARLAPVIGRVTSDPALDIVKLGNELQPFIGNGMRIGLIDIMQLAPRVRPTGDRRYQPPLTVGCMPRMDRSCIKAATVNLCPSNAQGPSRRGALRQWARDPPQTAAQQKRDYSRPERRSLSRLWRHRTCPARDTNPRWQGRMDEQIGAPASAFDTYALRPATASDHAREATDTLGPSGPSNAELPGRGGGKSRMVHRSRLASLTRSEHNTLRCHRRRPSSAPGLRDAPAPGVALTTPCSRARPRKAWPSSKRCLSSIRKSV